MRVLYFDLEVTGYHIGHVNLFIDHALDDARVEDVLFILPAAFADARYAATRRRIEDSPKLGWKPCSDEAAELWSSWHKAGGKRARASVLGLGRLKEIRRVLEAHPDRYLFDSLFDSTLAASAMDRRRLPRRFTGTVHFCSAALFDPRPMIRLRQMALYILANHRDIPIVLTFDKLFLERAPKPATRGWRFIPDPLPVSPGQWRRLFALGPATNAARTRFAMFGSMGRRKGGFSVLEAMRTMTPEALATVEIFIGGHYAEGGDAERDAFVAGVEELRARDPNCIRYENRFLSDDELIDELERSHVVLAPYLGHGGVSSVLVWAAAAGRPILTQDTGWLAQMTHSRKLGVTCATADPQSVAEAMLSLREANVRAQFPIDDMRRFAEPHTPAAFYDEIIRALTVLSSN